MLPCKKKKKKKKKKNTYIILTTLHPLKLGFTGVYIIFLISAQKIDCGNSLEPPRRGGSNEYHNLSFEQKYENISFFFLSENFQFLVVKFSIYLNTRVFVMFEITADT